MEQNSAYLIDNLLAGNAYLYGMLFINLFQTLFFFEGDRFMTTLI